MQTTAPDDMPTLWSPHARLFVAISDELLPVDTIDQIEAAQAALNATALRCGPVYVTRERRPPVTTGDLLYADPPVRDWLRSILVSMQEAAR